MDSEEKQPDVEEKELRRKIYKLENQIAALSDQAWAHLRDGRDRMKRICAEVDENKNISYEDLLFLRIMVGYILAELACRKVND